MSLIGTVYIFISDCRRQEVIVINSMLPLFVNS